MEGLFDSEFEFEFEEFEGLKLKMKPRDAGQVDTQVHLTLWPAAQELCKQSHLFIQPNASVLELGAGIGLVGIYIKLHFGNEVVLTDGNKESVDLIAENAMLNNAIVSTQVLVWGDSGPKSDIIIGSDIIYSVTAIKPLIQTIKKTLAVNGFCVLANHLVRFGYLERAFYEACGEEGIEITNIVSITDPLIKVISLRLR